MNVVVEIGPLLKSAIEFVAIASALGFIFGKIFE